MSANHMGRPLESVPGPEDVGTPNNNRAASAWHNVFNSFLASQGNERLHEDLMYAHAVTHPDSFDAMYAAYLVTDEPSLIAVDKQLQGPYKNPRLHPGQVEEEKYRRKGTGTLVAALGNAAILRATSPETTQISPGLLLRIAGRMADSDAHYLSRPERRNKPEVPGHYTLLRANSASHLLHYMFLEDRTNYPHDSIMQTALAAAANLRQQIEDGTIVPNSRNSDVWLVRCGAFRTHLQAYPEHAPYVSRGFSDFMDAVNALSTQE